MEGFDPGEDGSDATTQGVQVQVRPEFRPDLSDPERGSFMWQYTVCITNHGQRAVKLLARHWEITDGDGDVEHVRGPGVIGEQPRIEPGEAHTYASGCPLSTSMGSMRGSYLMTYDDGSRFEAEVAPFALVVPDLLN